MLDGPPHRADPNPPSLQPTVRGALADAGGLGPAAAGDRLRDSIRSTSNRLL